MDIAELGDSILKGDRRALSRAITLVESRRADHRAQAAELLDRLAVAGRQALRVGLSGTPGVGKSTFIESFGMMLIGRGLKVAVLAVDPSSARSGGSILGDKTRMDRLARERSAFIRPSPSQSHLGGVARRTREAVALCEAAGFVFVLIEAVGVGQSETVVAEMSDLFLLLLAPAGGDELQGVKRGIMETADIILVNKADGPLKPVATRTCADYAGALRLLRKRPQDAPGFPKAITASALHEEGLGAVWDEIRALASWRDDERRVEAEIDLQTALGIALIAYKGWAAPEVGAAYERARKLCGKRSDPTRVFQVFYGLWVFYLNTRVHFNEVKLTIFV